MAAAAVLDIGYLSHYCALPEPTIQTLIDNPTSDLVTSFLQTIIEKAQDHERLKAERLRLDVELENAVRGAEVRTRGLKANAEKALQEVDTLRVKLNEDELARTELSSQLQLLQSDSSNTTAEVSALHGQVDRLEKSNRDTLSLLDSKSTAHDKVVEELSSQHQKSIELRREVSTLKEQIQSAENSLTNAKVLEARLKEEIELQKRNNAYFDTELKTKASEYSKFRKEKNAKVAELQRVNEDAAQHIEGLQRTETALRKRVEEVGQKADEAFTKVQQLEEDGARTEQSFRQELDTARRLADLQKQSADTARRRVQELEEMLEQTKDDAAEEISQAQAEIETERQGRETAERRVEQLESQVEKLETISSAFERGASPATPRPAVNGISSLGTPGRGSSPLLFSPRSSRSRGGLSLTEMYTEYNNARTELEAEKRRNERLSSTLDEIMQEMEKKEPEAQESQLEHDRLQRENTELSALLASTRQEKDSAKKETRKLQVQVDGLRREGELRQQSLRDLSVQIKTLLIEVQIQQEGVEVTAADRLRIQQAARNEVDSEALEGLSDTARFISQRLVSFKNVFEMQEKNTELIRIVRELGEQKEAEEAKGKANQQPNVQVEVEGLRERVERYKEEIKSLVKQSESYISERDRFRRMLSHRGQIPPETDLDAMFGSSVNGSGTPRTPHSSQLLSGADQSPMTKDLADYAKLLKELQSQFDAYRRETATDYSTVKEQAAALANEKSRLQSENARVSSQLTLAQERYQMLQANLDMLRTENGEARKRSQSLAEIAAKQDLKTQQVAEELIDARGLTEGLRTENANLKAEKEFWKRIEARLSDENKALTEDKGRLSKSLTDAQNLFNERELSDSETRRKLQSQIEALETELKTIKQKLDDELEFSKNANLRREYESDHSRTRIDDLVKLLSNTKEELAAATASRDQLQARIAEIKIELRTAEERSQALQPKTVSQMGTTPDDDQPTSRDSALSRDQELAMEVADLRGNLDLVRTELENAMTQVEQFKAISQSSEDELQNLNESHDQYCEETDKLIAEKDAKITDLEQRMQEISSELSITNDQLSAVRATADESTRRLDQQRAMFESEISLIKDEEERYKETAAFHQEDLKAQAEIAQQAQQSYENELVKHAEAAQTLQVVRAELNQVKLEVSTSKADAEAARTTMAQSEESWSTMREQYENELAEMKTRRDDINAQNTVLHQQLESFTTQITALKQMRHASDSVEEMLGGPDLGVQNLQEVIKFIRREKEIVDVQYELAVQEAKRLRQQLDYSHSQIDEARLRLDQERQRQVDRERSAISHNKLMDTINELNVFRESNVTLRNATEQAKAQLAEKSKHAEDLITKIQPLESSIRELENERETLQGEYKLLEEDRNRWQQRTQNILQKYDRIDPAELEALKEQIVKLQSEREEVANQTKILQDRVEGIPEEVRLAQEEARNQLRLKLVEQFKGRSRELSGKINEANAAAQSAEKRLETVTIELEAAKGARDEAITKAQEIESRLPKSTPPTGGPGTGASMQDGVEDGQVEEGEVSNEGVNESDLQGKMEAATAKAHEEAGKAAQAQAVASGLRERASELERQVAELEQNLRVAHEEISTLRAQSQTTGNVESTENLEKVKEELAAAQKEVEAMRLEAQNKLLSNTAGNSETPLSDQGQAIVASKQAELETNHAQRVQQLEEQFKTRTENMRKQLSSKLAEGKNSIRVELSREHEEAIQKLNLEHDSVLQRDRQEHEASLAQLKTAHQRELEQVREQERLERVKLQQASSSKTSEVDPPISAPAATENAFNEDSTVKVKAEEMVLAADWTPPQVRTFILSNPTAKEIVTRNIRQKLDLETTKIKEQSEKDHAEKLKEVTQQSEKMLTEKLDEARNNSEKSLAEKLAEAKVEADRLLAEKLEEARQRAEKAKEQAVNMEGKKWNVKISMAEGKARTATAKIDIVAKAASETPQLPVAEVWARAKDAKAPPPATTPLPAGASNTSTNPQSSPASLPAPLRKPSNVTATNASNTVTDAPPTATGPAARNVPPPQRKESGASMAAKPLSPVSSSVNGKPPATAAQPATEQTEAQAPTPPAPPAPQQVTATGPAAIRGIANQGSGIPRGGANIRGIARGGRGGGGGLPEIPPSANVPPAPHIQQQGQRGGVPSNLPRGGGRGRGRGQQVGASVQDGSPGVGRGAMNPRAGQFMPGNKRPRADSPAGNDENAGKRVRGGGGAGGSG